MKYKKKWYIYKQIQYLLNSPLLSSCHVSVSIGASVRTRKVKTKKKRETRQRRKKKKRIQPHPGEIPTGDGILGGGGIAPANIEYPGSPGRFWSDSSGGGAVARGVKNSSRFALAAIATGEEEVDGFETCNGIFNDTEG